MDLRFTDSENAFREEVRAFFRERLPPKLRRKCELGQRMSRADIVTWQRILHDRGWAVPAWPEEWGGCGWSAAQLSIFREEMYLTPAPEPLTFNVNMVGPVIAAFGTEEQKAHFLPRIANLDYWFCQGFSEPGSGSDLASLRTRAMRDGDHYVVNGQKIWTTLAHHADWCFMLVRTDPDVKPQMGITYLLMDMKTPGVTVRPIVTIDGHHEFNEVFLDDVRIPVTNRIGDENLGWTYAKFLLGNERAAVARTGLCKQRVEQAKKLAPAIMSGGKPLSEDPRFRERIALLEVEMKTLEMLQMRVISQSAQAGTGRPDPMAPILKIKGSEMQQVTSELLRELAGYEAMEFDHDFLHGTRVSTEGEDWALATAPNQYWLRHTSISGGTNEIQRNIIAKAVLGLR